MAPKGRKAPRRTGSGAAKAVAVVAVEGEAAEDTTRLCFLPADPEDPRLTLEGLVLGGDGKIDIVAYADLKVHYAREPSPDQHPDPEHPGVRRGEFIPKGLRVWDDIRAGASEKDGAGWAVVRYASANEKKQEKWFNIRTCGSWRLAFFLAKMQRLHWDERSAWLKAPVPAIGTTAAAEAATAKKEKVTETPPPKGKRPATDGEGEGEAPAPKAAKRATPKKAAAKQQPQEEQPAAKRQMIGVDVVAGSARLQQILAMRQQQQPQPQQQRQA